MSLPSSPARSILPLAMKPAASAPTTIDEYIASCPEEVRPILESIRSTIQKTAPDATEKISYQMPTFFQKGNLVHFAAWKAHIGLYPAPSGMGAFQKELARYHVAKGSVQFPLDEPMPLDLIRQIVQFRVTENLKKAEAKAKKPKRAAK